MDKVEARCLWDVEVRAPKRGFCHRSDRACFRYRAFVVLNTVTPLSRYVRCLGLWNMEVELREMEALLKVRAVLVESPRATNNTYHNNINTGIRITLRQYSVANSRNWILRADRTIVHSSSNYSITCPGHGHSPPPNGNGILSVFGVTHPTFILREPYLARGLSTANIKSETSCSIFAEHSPSPSSGENVLATKNSFIYQWGGHVVGRAKETCAVSEFMDPDLIPSDSNPRTRTIFWTLNGFCINLKHRGQVRYRHKQDPS